MATYLLLAFTDGTTTITFASGTTATPGNYSVSSQWAPKVARRRLDALGSNGPFEEVTEEIPINITGSSVSNLYANVNALARLFDNADRYVGGDVSISPVRMQYIPAGSAVAAGNPYEALVLGAVSRGLGALMLPESWSKAAATTFVVNATLRFRRAGAWLAQAESPASSAATNVADVWSITLASHDTQSPVDLTWTYPTTSNVAGPDSCWPSIMAMTNAAAKIEVYESSSFTTGGSFSTVAAANARGGSVLRSAAAGGGSNSGSVPAILTSAGRFLVLASLTHSTGGTTADWTVRLDVYSQATYGAGASIATSRTPSVTFTGDTNGLASAMVLGEIVIPVASHPWFVQWVVASTNTSGAPTLDLDYLVFLRVDDDLRVWSLDSIAVNSSLWGTSVALTVRHSSGALALVPSPPRLTSASREAPFPAPGGDFYLPARGTTLTGIWMASGNSGGVYRLSQEPPAAAGTVHQTTVTATRRRAYLVPE